MDLLQGSECTGSNRPKTVMLCEHQNKLSTDLNPSSDVCVTFETMIASLMDGGRLCIHKSIIYLEAVNLLLTIQLTNYERRYIVFSKT